MLKSTGKDNWNAIDPAHRPQRRPRLSRLWLVLGRHQMRGSSIRTPASCSPRTPRPTTPPRASGAAIEAASILEHDGRFYLFVSFDQCCKQLDSTYNIRGRPRRRGDRPPISIATANRCSPAAARCSSARPAASSRPGGQEAIVTSKGEMLAYHYYDGDDLGSVETPVLAAPMDPDGWPELDALPE